MKYSYTEPFSMNNVPESLIAEIANQLHVHTTALFKLWMDNNGQRQGLQIGSGTFVSIGAGYGILTAQHVAEQLADPYILGLSVAREGQEDSMSVKRESMRIFEVGKPEQAEFGPDLAFIMLTDWNDVSTIRASRSMYPLDNFREELLNSPPPMDAGIWFFCGSPEAYFAEEESTRGFSKILSFRQMCYAAVPSVMHERGDYDYVDLDAEKDVSPLKSYAGMSGGGLWQVTVERLKDGSIIPKRYLFSGVTFYQGMRSNEIRFIRCHGRKSVYSHVVSAVKGTSG
jgi:hypothetical protein